MIKRLLFILLTPLAVFVTGLLLPILVIYWIITGNFFKSPIEILEQKCNV